jgi:acyl-CoA thioester hydrolase
MIEYPSATISYKVQFHDLDPMDIVWHGNYLRIMELARSELLDVIGYNYPQMRDSGFAWPIVDLRVKYVKSIRFGQTVNVTATILEHEYRLKIGYLIRDASMGIRLTKAHTIQVAVSIETGELCLESPPVLFSKIQGQL